MERALELAARGRGMTSPNPMVGAVVVLDGGIVGEGWHRRIGEAHAEVNALAAAGERARGADLYVTLEPCAHHGRTPPCVEAIHRAGIRKVIAPMVDPNPLVNGRGIVRLREHGIEVEVGLKEAEARRLNEAYLKRVVKGLPFVTLKMALSLDGKLAARSGDARWITNEEARARAHRMRGENDAVLVGAGTMLADDPLLNVRLPGWTGRQPLRVILDAALRTPHAARLLHDVSGGAVLVAASLEAPEDNAADLQAVGAEVLRLPAPAGRIDLAALLRELAGRGVTSLLVEGGAKVITSVLEAGLADKVAAFVAPVLIGGADAPSLVPGPGAGRMAEALRLRDVRVETIGDNVLLEGYL